MKYDIAHIPLLPPPPPYFSTRLYQRRKEQQEQEWRSKGGGSPFEKSNFIGDPMPLRLAPLVKKFFLDSCTDSSSTPQNQVVGC